MKENKINLEKLVGQKVTLKGKISKEIWQHMFKHFETHPHENYVDLSGDFRQIVAYTKEEIECDEASLIEFKGKLIKISGNKRPKSKVNEEYHEYQLIVDSWRCLDY